MIDTLQDQNFLKLGFQIELSDNLEIETLGCKLIDTDNATKTSNCIATNYYLILSYKNRHNY